MNEKRPKISTSDRWW